MWIPRSAGLTPVPHPNRPLEALNEISFESRRNIAVPSRVEAVHKDVPASPAGMIRKPSAYPRRRRKGSVAMENLDARRTYVRLLACACNLSSVLTCSLMLHFAGHRMLEQTLHEHPMEEEEVEEESIAGSFRSFGALNSARTDSLRSIGTAVTYSSARSMDSLLSSDTQSPAGPRRGSIHDNVTELDLAPEMMQHPSESAARRGSKSADGAGRRSSYVRLCGLYGWHCGSSCLTRCGVLVLV